MLGGLLREREAKMMTEAKVKGREIRRCYPAVFEEGGRGHEPRNVAVSSHWKILLRSLQKSEALPTPWF